MPQQFYERVTDRFCDEIQHICGTTPELQSVLVVFDWGEELNAAAPLLLCGDDAGPLHPAKVQSTITLMAQLAKANVELTHLTAQSLGLLSKSLKQIEAELHAQEEAKAQLQGEAPAGSVPGGSPESTED